jgi:hypothetical protein
MSDKPDPGKWFQPTRDRRLRSRSEHPFALHFYVSGILAFRYHITAFAVAFCNDI